MGLDLRGVATEYGADFFAGIEDGGRRSAEIVVPLLLELFSPQSVVDVGGGAGHWAAACLAASVSDVLVIDGPWVPELARVIPSSCFLERDLSRPLVLDRTFDLALCLETAEHLPDSVAPELVRTLTDAAPVVVFSAALPGQGGHGHINEQLPSYWASLFAERGYACFSDLRQRIWYNEAIEVWYRQNLLCFVRNTELHRWRKVLADPIKEGDPLLDVAHPVFLFRHKSRADRLELYARRLEADAERFRPKLDRLEAETERLRLELSRITNSRAWRAWQIAAGPIRLLKRRLPQLRKDDPCSP